MPAETIKIIACSRRVRSWIQDCLKQASDPASPTIQQSICTCFSFFSYIYVFWYVHIRMYVSLCTSISIHLCLYLPLSSSLYFTPTLALSLMVSYCICAYVICVHWYFCHFWSVCPIGSQVTVPHRSEVSQWIALGRARILFVCIAFAYILLGPRLN